MIEVALVGCGHMGRHHARIVSEHPRCRLVATVDRHPERAMALAERCGARALAAVPGEVDAVIVATPTTTHVEVAAPLVARGQWCLIEKALADTAEAAERLASPRVAVGHSERFNPAVRTAARAIGGRPIRRFVSRRVVPGTGRARDVDVVLDLIVHDVDVLLSWAGAVEVVEARGAPAEEVLVRLRTEAGEAELVASRVHRRPERRIDVHGPDHELALDLLAGRAWQAGEELPAPDPRDALTAQWDAFLDRMAGLPGPAATAREAIDALRVVERIRAVLRDTGAG